MPVVFGGGAKKSGRQQGQIVDVLQRKQSEFLGRIEIGKTAAFFIADTEKPMPDVFIPQDALKGAVHNDRVIVRITEWEKQKKPVKQNNRPKYTFFIYFDFLYNKSTQFNKINMLAR